MKAERRLLVVIDQGDPAEDRGVDDKGWPAGAHRPLVVTGDQRRHGAEHIGDVDAVDCDELAADKILAAGANDEDAVVELVEHDWVRVACDRMVVEWMNS